MRADGRKRNELRSFTITPDYSSYAEGSVIIALGHTRVLCNATIEAGVPRWMQAQGVRGRWITVKYATTNPAYSVVARSPRLRRDPPQVASRAKNLYRSWSGGRSLAARQGQVGPAGRRPSPWWRSHKGQM
jgi:ribonuclease PH